MNDFPLYLLVMSLITYLIRLVPLLLFKKKITNKYVVSFLHYMPSTILAVMSIPAILYVTNHIISGIGGLVVGLIFAYKDKSLLTVAIAASFATLIVELLFSVVF